MRRNILLFGMVLMGSAANAATPIQQSDDNEWLTLDFVRQTTPWLRSSNAAGMNEMKIKKISEAELFFDKGNGQWVNYNESDNDLQAGIGAGSYFRLNQEIVLTGQIGYSFYQGQNMGGSYLIDPYHAPFDIVDLNEESRGKKRKETYHVMGGVSGRINKHWILGGKFDYHAINFTKQKDLRHTNHLMDLVISPAVVFEANDRLKLGIDYLYQRKNEGITYQTFGTTDKIYNSLISYGAFWGTKEEFGTNGYTKGNENKPLVDQFHQGDFQLEWNMSSRLSLFNEVGYKKRKGHYGVQSPHTIVNSNHNSDIVLNHTTFAMKYPTHHHYINVGFEWERLNNFENIYRYDNESGGLQDVGYYGQIKTGHKTCWNLNADYTLHLNMQNGLPAWVVNAGYATQKRSTRASYYPSYRIQQLHTHRYHLAAQYNLYKQKNQYSFLLAAQYGYGLGDKSADGTFTPDAEVQNPMQSHNNFLDQEFEYFTTRQMNYNLQAKYARKLKDSKIVGYCSINYNFAFAPKIQYIKGDRHHLLSLKIGCKF